MDGYQDQQRRTLDVIRLAVVPGQAAVAGTVAENAELFIEYGEVIVTCTECGAESPAKPNRLLCAACGDFRTRLISGDEMILERIELTPRQPVAGDVVTPVS